MCNPPQQLSQVLQRFALYKCFLIVSIKQCARTMHKQPCAAISSTKSKRHRNATINRQDVLFVLKDCHMILEAGFLDDATWDLSATIVCIYRLFTAMNGSNIYVYRYRYISMY